MTTPAIPFIIPRQYEENKMENNLKNNNSITPERLIPSIDMARNAIKMAFYTLWMDGKPFTAYSIFQKLVADYPAFEWRHLESLNYPSVSVQEEVWGDGGLVDTVDIQKMPFDVEWRNWNGNEARTIIPTVIKVLEPEQETETLPEPEPEPEPVTPKSAITLQVGDHYVTVMGATNYEGLTKYGNEDSIPLFTFIAGRNK